MRSHMKKQHGVTLMELMIVIVIVGILAAIAVPSYSSHVRKTRRNMAAACLEENAQFLERWYTTKLTYEGASATMCPAEIQPFYDVEVDVTDARSFTATATPKAAQLEDKCGVMTLNEKGQRDSEGSAADGCW